MKKKLLDFLTRWEAAKKVMQSKHFIVIVDDASDKYEVAHNEVPVETIRKAVGYLNLKVMIDFQNQSENGL